MLSTTPRVVQRSGAPRLTRIRIQHFRRRFRLTMSRNLQRANVVLLPEHLDHHAMGSIVGHRIWNPHFLSSNRHLAKRAAINDFKHTLALAWREMIYRANATKGEKMASFFFTFMAFPFTVNVSNRPSAAAFSKSACLDMVRKTSSKVVRPNCRSEIPSSAFLSSKSLKKPCESTQTRSRDHQENSNPKRRTTCSLFCPSHLYPLKSLYLGIYLICFFGSRAIDLYDQSVHDH